MYKTKEDVDEHVHSELNKLISKFESTEDDARKLKNILNNYVKNTKQDHNIENTLDSIIKKCNDAQNYIKSKN